MPTAFPAMRLRSARKCSRSETARFHAGPALIDFRVEQEDSVYPMVPAGADLDAMIRRPTPLVERASDD